MVCLDTSVIVALLRKDEGAVAKLAQAAAEGRTVGTTVVNLCELYAGANGSKRVAQELRKVERVTSLLQTFGFGVDSAKRYGELVNAPALKQKPIGDFDLIIAAIALSSDEAVATRNIEHFSRVPGLEVEYW